MLKVLVDVRVNSAALEKLQGMSGVNVTVVPFADTMRELPREVLQDIEVLLCTFPPSNFEDLEKLRWIQIASSGYSQLFRCHLAAKGIRATNARGCFDVPIAEWNVAMMVNLVRNLPQMARNQASQVWDRSAEFQRELRSLTVGIWGYGGLGRETARMAKCLGMKVHVCSRSGVQPAHKVYRVPGTGDPEGTLPDRVFASGEEADFLSELDFLILAMPLTPATEGMIGERELTSLPRHAFLLNPARGPIVKEQALLTALDQGWIAGAALDTHYHYPMPPDHPLWRYPNVIFTPHISGSSLNPNFTTRLWEIFLGNVKRYRNGEPLWNEIPAHELQGE